MRVFSNCLIKILSLLTTSSWTVYAAAGNAKIPPARLSGVRPLGMGGAFTAIADDQNALYYNPAGLAKRTDWTGELITPIMGWNNNVQENIDSFKSLVSTVQNKTDDVEKFVKDLDPILKNISGENHYIRVAVNPYFVMKNFGFGIFINEEAEVVPHKNGLPTIIDFSNQFDVDVRFGLAKQFMGEKLALGATIAARLRNSIVLDEFGLFKLYDVAKNETSQKASIQDAIKLGTAFPLDLGLLFTPIKTLEPTLGVAIQNFGDAKFQTIKTKANNGKPYALPMSVNFGLSVKKNIGKSFLKPALEFRDVNQPIPASQKAAIGVDWGIAGRFASAAGQLGLSEGYLSAGFELKLLVLNIRYATYATNRGYFESTNRERRHLIGLKILL